MVRSFYIPPMSLTRVAPESVLFFYFLSWLVPFFKSLPLTPNEGFYAYVWFVLLAAFSPSLLWYRQIVPVFLILALHILYIITGNYDGFSPKSKTMLDVFVMYGFPVTIFTYFFSRFSFDTTRRFSVMILTFLAITSLSTLLVLFRIPEASRALAGNDNQEEIDFLLRMNVGGYSLIYTLAVISPLMLYFYRLRGKVVWILLFALFSSVIFYAQFSAAVVLFLVNVFLTVVLLCRVRFRNYLLLVFGLLVSVFLLSDVFVSVLRVFLDYVDGLDLVHTKLKEIIMYLEGGDLRGTSMEAYNIRYRLSLEAFLKSPIVGGYSGGGHHYWLDVLALYGMLGGFLILWLFWQFISVCCRFPIFLNLERRLLVHFMLMFLAIGVNKNIVSSMPMIVLVICPLLLATFGHFGMRQRYE